MKEKSLIYNPQTSFPNNEPTDVGLGIKPKSTGDISSHRCGSYSIDQASGSVSFACDASELPTGSSSSELSPFITSSWRAWIFHHQCQCILTLPLFPLGHCPSLDHHLHPQCRPLLVLLLDRIRFLRQSLSQFDPQMYCDPTKSKHSMIPIRPTKYFHLLS